MKTCALCSHRWVCSMLKLVEANNERTTKHPGPGWDGLSAYFFLPSDSIASICQQFAEDKDG